MDCNLIPLGDPRLENISFYRSEHTISLKNVSTALFDVLSSLLEYGDGDKEVFDSG